MNVSLLQYFRRRMRRFFQRSARLGRPLVERVKRRKSFGSLRGSKTGAGNSSAEETATSVGSVTSSVRSLRRRIPFFVRQGLLRPRRRRSRSRVDQEIASVNNTEAEGIDGMDGTSATTAGITMTQSASSPPVTFSSRSSPHHLTTPNNLQPGAMGATMSVPVSAPSASSTFSNKSPTQSPNTGGSARRKPPSPPGPPSLASQQQYNSTTTRGGASAAPSSTMRTKGLHPISQFYSHGRPMSTGVTATSTTTSNPIAGSTGPENFRPNNSTPFPTSGTGSSNPAQLSPLPRSYPYPIQSQSHSPNINQSPNSNNSTSRGRNSYYSPPPPLPPKSPNANANLGNPNPGYSYNSYHVNASSGANSHSQTKSPPITRLRTESTSSESDMVFGLSRGANGGAIPVTLPLRRSGERDKGYVRERRDSDREKVKKSDSDRDRERERVREKEKEREGERERKEKERDREKDRERDRGYERERERKTSNSRRPSSSQGRYPNPTSQSSSSAPITSATTAPQSTTHHIYIPPQAPSASSATTSNPNTTPQHGGMGLRPPAAMPTNTSNTVRPAAAQVQTKNTLRPNAQTGNRPVRSVHFRETLFFAPTPPGSIPASPAPSVRPSKSSKGRRSSTSRDRYGGYSAYSLNGAMVGGQESSGAESSEIPNANGYYSAPGAMGKEKDTSKGHSRSASYSRTQSQPVGVSDSNSNSYPARSRSKSSHTRSYSNSSTTPHTTSSSQPATTPSTGFIPPPRRQGWFNSYGDQLWTNSGGYVAPPPGFENPPDLIGYPKRGEGWMNEKGRVIDMQHRLVHVVDFSGRVKDGKGGEKKGGVGFGGRVLKSALKKKT